MAEYTSEEIEQYIFNAGSDDVATFGGRFVEGSIQAQQVPDELAPCLVKMLTGEAIDNYLEIGSAAGGSAFIVNRFLKPKRIVLVDDNKHHKAHIRNYILQNVHREEIIGDSHDEEVLNKVKGLNIVFDALMIDGDHFYNGIKQDMDNYGKFLKDDGFLMLHDSVIGNPYGCTKFFEELKRDKRWEFVAEFVSRKYNKCGIGLFKKKKEEREVKSLWVPAGAKAKKSK